MITIEQARQALGAKSEGMTDDEVLQIISLFSSMARQLLDSEETKIFGKTINDLVTTNKTS